MTKIDGNLIKEHVKNECKPYKQQLEGKEISIIRFEHPEGSKKQEVAMYKAALVSENQKVKTFEAIGVKANRVTLIPEETSVEQFQEIIQSINQDNNIKAAIVQFPVPPELILAKELLHGVSHYVFQQSFNFQSPSTNPSAKKLFEILKDTFIKSQNKKYLSGSKYSLESNIGNNTFFLYRMNENIILIQSEMRSHQVKLVNGLTDEDVKQWERIGEILQVDYRGSVKVNNSDAKS